MTFEFLYRPKCPLARVFHVARAFFHASVRGHDVRVHLPLRGALLLADGAAADVGKRLEMA